jgi:hypothetical protein
MDHLPAICVEIEQEQHTPAVGYRVMLRVDVKGGHVNQSSVRCIPHSVMDRNKISGLRNIGDNTVVT